MLYHDRNTEHGMARIQDPPHTHQPLSKGTALCIKAPVFPITWIVVLTCNQMQHRINGEWNTIKSPVDLAGLFVYPKLWITVQDHQDHSTC